MTDSVMNLSRSRSHRNGPLLHELLSELVVVEDANAGPVEQEVDLPDLDSLVQGLGDLGLDPVVPAALQDLEPGIVDLWSGSGTPPRFPRCRRR